MKKKTKKLATLLLFLIICDYSFAVEKMYYCSEILSTGFEPKENFKLKKYSSDRFKAKIDIDNNFFSSKDLSMSNTKCERMISKWSHLMQCKTTYGSFFVLNTKNLRFGVSHLIGLDGKDSIALGHGKCEEF
tara:strand:+ start:116 stop:511 length:396 start_codon:yes stop_codon:yes gene_type:complete